MAAFRPIAAAAAIGLVSFAYLSTSGSTQVAPVAPPTTNRAFVFVKPHACNAKVEALVRETMEKRGITVKSEGEIEAERIDKEMLIDQHYYALAQKATLSKPAQLNVDNAKFSKHFGENWADVLAAGRAFNALDACKELGVDAMGLNALWAKAKKDDRLCKLGGGFYSGAIMNPKTGKNIYVMNGFFMSMRAEFTAPGTKIHYYDVEFEPSQLTWADFRGKLLGPTDPATAPADSLRGQVLAKKKELGVDVVNVGLNGIHASASRFEALAEDMNWLKVKCTDDQFCRALVSAGIPEATIGKWTTDPQVKLDASGKKGSLFDAVEDLDSKPCLEKLVEIYSYNNKQ